MPFAVTWMDLESIILREASQTEKGEIVCDITYSWNLKRDDTSELTEQKQTQRLPEQTYGSWRVGIGERDSQGVWDGHVHTTLFKMGNRPTVQHMKL